MSSAESNTQVHSEHTSRAKNKWTLTPEAFEKLLNSFSTDREEAGVQYELMRRKLVRYFEFRFLEPPDEYTDETINRVARRIDEGQTIDNLKGYFYGVARMVAMEALKDQKRNAIPLDEVPPNLQPTQIIDPDPDTRLSCLGRCMASLPDANQTLIRAYYEGERRVKIERRQRLANNLKLPLNALRIRAHRIRVGLEKCITQCMSSPG